MSGPVRKDDPTLPPPWQALQGALRAPPVSHTADLHLTLACRVQQTAPPITGIRAPT
jgi:hypothetical protein